ncbi:MAG TPA: hypothetical protein VGD88_16890 [Opitutaceae bacterium]
MKTAACLFLTAAAAVTLLGQTPQISAPAPVKNFSLPFFNEAGNRTLLVRGNEAILTNPRQPAFTDMTVTMFAGDASNRVESVLLSKAATVDTTTSIIEGTDTVRFVRDDIEVTGETWRYEHNARRIVIQRKARVVFRAELPLLLK